MNRITNNNS